MANRTQYYYNPLDLDDDVAIGLKIKFGNLNNTTIPKSQIAASGSISPLNDSQHSLFELNYTTNDQAKSNLYSLLLTRKGERLMHPDFGVGLHYYIYEPMVDNLKLLIQSELKSNINYWLPYIIIDDITVEFAGEYQISIKLTFKITDSGFGETIRIFIDQSGVTIDGE